MKFTLYPNDELKFKIKQSWDLSAPETLIEGSYCYKYIKYLVSSRENTISHIALLGLTFYV